MTREEKFMQEAIALSSHGVNNNEGGPFGCVVVQGDKMIAAGPKEKISIPVSSIKINYSYLGWLSPSGSIVND